MFLENKNKKIAQGMGSTRSVRLATRYEKARQDVGLFYVLNLVFRIRDFMLNTWCLRPHSFFQVSEILI